MTRNKLKKHLPHHIFESQTKTDQFMYPPNQGHKKTNFGAFLILEKCVA